MAEPTKKSSPFPIDKVTEQPEAARAERQLSPIRKLALPIGVAASLVLAGAGVGAYAYAASSKAIATTDDSDDGCPTRTANRSSTDSFFVRAVERAKAFLDPTPPPRMAGEVTIAPPVAPLPPGSASGPTPAPPIPPNPNPPPLPGKRSMPNQTPVSTPVVAQPDPNHPKLGGAPKATPPI